ncbi:MAG TPA: hypothetical protein VGM56_03470 [Byssovorax sp.]|jgi:hypothetical protein
MSQFRSGRERPQTPTSPRSVRSGLRLSGACAAIAALAIGLSSNDARAQQPMQGPPPGYAPAPSPYPAPQPYAQPYQQQPGAYPPPVYYQPQPVYVVPPGQRQMGPRVMDYDDGPIPAGYHVETRVKKGLVIAGAAVLGSFWLLSALGGALAIDAGHDHDAEGLFVPVAGPFVALANETAGSKHLLATVQFCYVLDGLAQSAGLLMLVGGIVFPSQKLVRDEVALDVGGTKVRFHPTPMRVGDNSVGFGLAGSM